MKNIRQFFDNLSLYNKILLIVAISVFIAFDFLTVRHEQEFALLARSFMEGRANLPDNHFFLDTINYKDKIYWPLGPFPAIILIPFVYLADLFQITLLQGYIQFAFNLGVFILCYKISRLFKYSPNDSMLMAFAFCFASVYQAIALYPIDHFFSQVVTTFLILYSIYRYLSKKINYFEVGLIYAFIFMTRFTAGLGVLFFVLDVTFLKEKSNKFKLVSLTKIAIPIVVAGIILMLYNYVRFDNPFDNGYKTANAYLLSEDDRFELLNYGLFQLRNIPTNFYYYFIKTVDPVILDTNVRPYSGKIYTLQLPYIKAGYPGVGFFVVSPIFLYIFGIKKLGRIVKLSIVPIVLILLMLLSYYWPGWLQVGPRYLLDLLPFLFILLLASFTDGRLPRLAKYIIPASALLNFYLMLTVS